MVSITITFLRLVLNFVALQRIFDGICVLWLPDIGHFFGEITDGRNYKEGKRWIISSLNSFKIYAKCQRKNMSLINGRRAFFLSSTSKANTERKFESLEDGKKFSRAIFLWTYHADATRVDLNIQLFPCHKRNVFECSRMINIASGSFNKSSFNILWKSLWWKITL